MEDAAAVRRRLLTARVSRVKSPYTFTARTFIRGFAQYLSTDRELSDRHRLEKLDRQFFVKVS